jgi:hypothetical protein
MVNEGQAVLFTGGSVTWVDSGGNNPKLTSIHFAGTEVFTGSEKPTYFSYPTVVDFASLDNQVLTIQFDGPLGPGTHTLVSNFHNSSDGTSCSLTETFTVY